MTAKPRRLLVLGAALLIVCCAAAPAASAQQIKAENWTIGGSITIKKLNHTLPVPDGRFNATFDLGTGDVSGSVALPQATTRVKAFGLIPIDATVQLVEAGPFTGKITPLLPNIMLESNATFFLKVLKLSSSLGVVNSVGNNCRTREPLNLFLYYGGPFDVERGIVHKGTVTIPEFKDCLLGTGLLNSALAGPDNPYTLQITPTSSAQIDMGQAPPPLDSAPGMEPPLPVVEDSGSFGSFDYFDPTGLTDSTPPSLDVRVRGVQRLIRNGGAVVAARCDEACVVVATGKLRAGGRSYKLAPGGQALRAGKRTKLKVQLTRRATNALRRAVKIGSAASVKLGVRAQDAAGNRSPLSRSTVESVR